MNCKLSALLLTVAGLGACATATTSPKPAEKAWSEAAPGPAATLRAGRPGPMDMSSDGAMVAQGTDALDLFDSPAFRRRFTQSYLAETDIEPRITKDELKAMEKVLEYLGEEKTERAIELLKDERKDGPHPVFDFTLANIHFQRDELPRAAVLYTQAVERFPKFRRAWRNLALIRVRQGDYRRAAEGLTRVLELGGGSADTYGMLGYSHAALGNQLSAETAYRMATLLDPVTKDWQMGLAMCLFKQERYPDAAALCGALIEAEPDNGELWILQANAYIGMGEPMQAAENFELLQRMGESTFETLAGLGDIYINERLYGLAVDAYVTAMGSGLQGDADRILRAGQVISAGGEHLEARRLLGALEHVHGDALTDEQVKEALKLRARLAAIDGETAEEAGALEEIVKMDPLDGEALILLAQYYERSGSPEKAVFQFERASGIESSEAAACLGHAQLLVRQGDYGRALPLLRRAQSVEHRENVQAFMEQVERAAKGR